ncbi:uncharacterized protein SOCG_01352 [Schizosaccharomyces octosporus yFS286]|uniref:Uncharacterized protein n=1 Tax=Schizosaccharomyces octosporus (strain yFS286) TaxID=483514 RepID=S9RAJ9_SCHOY|nr:uncharacterized protein SOCG_01352 [Schizosaccharomyces octosporus yFS286]EPX71134.1 hypothetical protein SOCG_01352 [Schizosaccharomyces octosporus yFS286]
MKRSSSFGSRDLKRIKDSFGSEKNCLQDKELLHDSTETKKQNLQFTTKQDSKRFLLNENREIDSTIKTCLHIPLRGPFPAVKDINAENEGLRGFHSGSFLRTCFRVGELLKVYRSRPSTSLIVVEFFGKVRSHKCVGNIIQLELEDAFRGSKSPCIYGKLFSKESIASFLLEKGSLLRVIGNAACSEKLLKIMHVSSTDMDELIETYSMTCYERT